MKPVLPLALIVTVPLVWQLVAGAALAETTIELFAPPFAFVDVSHPPASFAKDGGGCENTVSVTVGTNNTITVNASTVAAAKCSNNGTATVNASGSTGFTYKLNAGGTYQASNIFTALASGNYTLFAKDGFGCENSVAATVSTNNTAGPLFTNVKNLLASRCVSCHSGPSPAGGRDFTQDCQIVTFSDRINQRAVVIGDMPQGGPMLTPAEKAIITNWITAGAKFTD